MRKNIYFLLLDWSRFDFALLACPYPPSRRASPRPSTLSLRLGAASRSRAVTRESCRSLADLASLGLVRILSRSGTSSEGEAVIGYYFVIPAYY